MLVPKQTNLQMQGKVCVVDDFMWLFLTFLCSRKTRKGSDAEMIHEVLQEHQQLQTSITGFSFSLSLPH
jgi:hypothetical protein